MPINILMARMNATCICTTQLCLISKIRVHVRFIYFYEYIHIFSFHSVSLYSRFHCQQRHQWYICVSAYLYMYICYCSYEFTIFPLIHPSFFHFTSSLADRKISLIVLIMWLSAEIIDYCYTLCSGHCSFYFPLVVILAHFILYSLDFTMLTIMPWAILLNALFN